MIDFLETLGADSLTLLWLPLLAWTLVALPFWWMLSRWSSASALTQYWGRMALLFALPLGLLAAWLAATVSLPAWSTSSPAAVMEGSFFVIAVGPSEAAAATGTVNWWYAALGGATLVASAIACWRLTRLAMDALALHRWRASLFLHEPADSLHELAEDLRRRMGVAPAFRLYVAPDSTSPMTFGIIRPTVLLPEGLLAHRRHLEMVLAHELVHVRRRDYLLHTLVLAVTGLFAIHPAVGRLGRAIHQYREMSCDAEVLHHEGVRRKDYAALLLQLADRAPSTTAHALSMAQPRSSLKQRIEAMTKRTFFQKSSTRLSLLLAATILGGATLVIACTDLVVDDPATPEVSEEHAEVVPPSDGDEAIFVVVEDMPAPIGGIADIQQRITYPEAARDEGIEGTVFIQFVVTSEGTVEDANVTRGVSPELDAAALRVIEETEFRPGMQRGMPVDVRMSIPIRFQLEDDSPPPAEEATSQNDHASSTQQRFAITSGMDGSIQLGDELRPVQIESIEGERADPADEHASYEETIRITLKESVSEQRKAEIQDWVDQAPGLDHVRVIIQ